MWRRRNISVYIDSTGSGGRGWVTHLLHLHVEEGGGEENVSTILDRYTKANIESSVILVLVGWGIFYD